MSVVLNHDRRGAPDAVHIHWLVIEIGDSTKAGIGHQAVRIQVEPAEHLQAPHRHQHRPIGTHVDRVAASVDVEGPSLHTLPCVDDG